MTMIELDQKKRSGSYYTKPEIVSLILDILGYTSEKPLFEYSLLEPATGEGAFLVQVVERLIESYKRYHVVNTLFSNQDYSFHLLRNAICSIEVDSLKYEKLRKNIFETLNKYNIPQTLITRLLDQWLISTDFLRWNKPVVQTFDFVVGNPPYIRIENLNNIDDKHYRRVYPTLYDRADIYIAFIEHGLEMLSNKGVLSYICTDRFTKNRYGKEIRRYINGNYHVVHFVDIHNTQPFVDQVSAYPCIFTLQKGSEGISRTLKLNALSAKQLENARSYLLKGEEIVDQDFSSHTLKNWFIGSDPWVLNGERARELLHKIEQSYPLITEAPHNIHVGIGVATGANDIYLVKPNEVDLESDILLPIVTKDDIKTGQVDWSGKYVINPYKNDGSLVDLEKYPKLMKYLNMHQERLKARSTAKNSPSKWYKTIDRIYPERLSIPKLLIPDIKSKNLVVLDSGQYYPEHSLYYLTAGSWDIQALQALLSCSIVKFFIWSYATKMRGDYLRYQAQYLKKIRLPTDISIDEIDLLKMYYHSGNLEGIEKLAQKLYSLTDDEMNDIRDLVN